jgi:hypothetical protein
MIEQQAECEDEILPKRPTDCMDDYYQDALGVMEGWGGGQLLQAVFLLGCAIIHAAHVIANSQKSEAVK